MAEDQSSSAYQPNPATPIVLVDKADSPFFDNVASNAIYPIRLMPSWLQVISRLNPLTYEVDGLRTFMLRNGVTTIGIGRDFLVLIATLTVLIGIAARLYPRMGE